MLITLLERIMFNDYSGISSAMETVFSSDLYIAFHSSLSVAVTKSVYFHYVPQSQYIVKGSQGRNSNCAGTLRVGTEVKAI